MKSSLVKSGFAIAVSALLFTSCEKSDNPAPSPTSLSEKKMTMQEIVSHPQFISAYKKLQDEFVAKHPEARAQFIAPFFTSNGFSVAQNLVFDMSGPFPVIVAGQFAGFNDDLDGNDFYRRNNDSTVSVHVSSNSCNAEHYDIATNVSKTTESGKLTMNYTGPVISFDITDENGNVIFTVNFIDIFSNPRAISFHGSGQVRENGTGPKQNLVAQWVCNPGWTQTNIGFTLN